jgi:hypothetical protein
MAEYVIISLVQWRSLSLSSFRILERMQQDLDGKESCGVLYIIDTNEQK